MSTLKTDDRVVGIEYVDRARSALVDNHSLMWLDSDFEDPGFAVSLTPRDLVLAPAGPELAHVIQTFVLYETILIDSVLLEIKPAVCHACDLFPDAVRGLFIRDSVRDRVARRVDAAVPRVMDRPLDMPVHLWNRWLQLDSSEKPLIDTMKDNAPRLIPFEYASDQDLLRQLERGAWSGFSTTCCNSMMTIARAHFYLELARELAVPLNMDPTRASYLRSIITACEAASAKNISESVIDKFVSQFSAEPSSEDVVSFDLRIPPVPELVLRVAKRCRISLYEATRQVRRSTNAVAFRNWCARLFTLREEGGLRARTEYHSIMKDFEHACEMWSRDTGEGVTHHTRTLRLGDIPLAGKVLRAVGLDELSIRDPVLVPARRYRYFLFLNDLLQAPHL
jgi:hypothetical protein